MFVIEMFVIASAAKQSSMSLTKAARSPFTPANQILLYSDLTSQNKWYSMTAWQIQEAKARLSEVVKCAESDGPQYITHHGQPVAVVVSQAMYSRLTCNERGLEDLMRFSPLFGSEDLHFERDPSLTRDVPL